jgi:HTH-type transcriptional regulator / antitoxin HipB
MTRGVLRSGKDVGAVATNSRVVHEALLRLVPERKERIVGWLIQPCYDSGRGQDGRRSQNSGSSSGETRRCASPASPAYSCRAGTPYTGYCTDITYRGYAEDYAARTHAQLGPILRSIRTERGLTQKHAGAKVGVKQSTVSAVESDSGHTSVDTLYKLLSALGLDVRDKTSDQSVAGVSKREW